MLGVGIEVGSPVYNGEVMPHLSDSSAPPVALAAALHRLFEADPSFGQAVPVIVENDVNALAVLAIHQTHYAEPDLVVVGVFDEGVGGGLVMDGRLRRGGNGRAMEIGHLAVGFPPGQQEQRRTRRNRAAEPVSRASRFLHQMLVRPLRACRHPRTATPHPGNARRHPPGPARRDRLPRSGVRGGPGRIRPQRRRPRPGPGARQQHRQSQQDHHLPARPLAEPKPDTAAAAYRSAVRQEVTSAFAAGDDGGLSENPRRFPPSQKTSPCWEPEPQPYASSKAS